MLVHVWVCPSVGLEHGNAHVAAGFRWYESNDNLLYLQNLYICRLLAFGWLSSAARVANWGKKGSEKKQKLMLTFEFNI